MQVVGAKAEADFEALLRSYGTQLDVYSPERQQFLLKALASIKSKSSSVDEMLSACRCPPSLRACPTVCCQKLSCQ